MTLRYRKERDRLIVEGNSKLFSPFVKKELVDARKLKGQENCWTAPALPENEAALKEKGAVFIEKNGIKRRIATNLW